MTALVGTLCLLSLPIAEYPEIAPPTIKVTARFPGATSQMISDTVAAVIEEQVNGIEDLLYFKSESDNNGNYTLTLTFKPGINSDIAQVNDMKLRPVVEKRIKGFPDIVHAIGAAFVVDRTAFFLDADYGQIHAFEVGELVLIAIDVNRLAQGLFARTVGLAETLLGYRLKENADVHF